MIKMVRKKNVFIKIKKENQFKEELSLIFYIESQLLLFADVKEYHVFNSNTNYKIRNKHFKKIIEKLSNHFKEDFDQKEVFDLLDIFYQIRCSIIHSNYSQLSKIVFPSYKKEEGNLSLELNYIIYPLFKNQIIKKLKNIIIFLKKMKILENTEKFKIGKELNLCKLILKNWSEIFYKCYLFEFYIRKEALKLGISVFSNDNLTSIDLEKIIQEIKKKISNDFVMEKIRVIQRVRNLVLHYNFFELIKFLEEKNNKIYKKKESISEIDIDDQEDISLFYEKPIRKFEDVFLSFIFGRSPAIFSSILYSNDLELIRDVDEIVSMRINKMF